MPNVGPLEIVIVLIIALLVFGPKRLPDLGRSLGRGINEFREGLSSIGDDPDEDEDDLDRSETDEEETVDPPELGPGEAPADLPIDPEPQVTEVTPTPESDSGTDRPADSAGGEAAPEPKS